MVKHTIVLPVKTVHCLKKRALSPKQVDLLRCEEHDGAVVLVKMANARAKQQLLTPFQRTVYTALCGVPRGYVTTYRHLAAEIGCRSCQAVGQALKRNPHAPVVPCHRVVQSNGSMGGFHGHRHGSMIEQKIKLLQDEGVRFTADGTSVDMACIYSFSEQEDHLDR